MTLLRIFACAAALACGVHAAEFRWTSQNDALTLDPHGNWEPFTRAMNFLVYEPLFSLDKQRRPVGWLAESWETPEPTRWVIHLRRGVKFHDGSDFTADDVVFSVERAARSESTVRVYAIQVGKARKIDGSTVEFITAAPNPVMLETLTIIPMMSKAWCEKHGVTRPQNWSQNEETYAVRNANGTGPFVLVSREPGIRTVHRKNPSWWGIAAGKFEGNVETIDYRPLDNSTTRIAALKSGQVDFVLDPSVQDVAKLREDPQLRIWDGSEIRVVYIGLDLGRDELLYSDVKGRNPFKDLRVRQALYQAIDVLALQRQVMRGASIPTTIALSDPVGAGVSPDLDRPRSFDPESAKRLLKAAGYPEGFGFTLHCPTDRVANGEKLCTALAAMWARIGVKVAPETPPRATFLAKVLAGDISAYLTSWGGALSDAIFVLAPVFHSPTNPRWGQGNHGNVKIERLDALIEAIDTEMNASKRQRLIEEAVMLLQSELPVIPLHRQVIPWVSRSNVSVVHSPDNRLNMIWVRVR